MNLEAFYQATATGQIFTVTFIKRTTGEERVMNCRRGVKKGVTGEGMAFDPKTKNLLCVFDLQADAYRMVNLEQLVALRMSGKLYTWTRDTFEEVV